MNRILSVDCQNVPVVQTDSKCQVASVCRGLALNVDLESLLVDWEREKFVHHISIPLLEILQNRSSNSSSLVSLVFVK